MTALGTIAFNPSKQGFSIEKTTIKNHFQHWNILLFLYQILMALNIHVYAIKSIIRSVMKITRGMPEKYDLCEY